MGPFLMTCACGCQQEVRPGRRFLHGHNRRGQTPTNARPASVALSSWIEQDMGFGTPCYIWTGNLSDKGYATVFLDGRHHRAHVESGPVELAKELMT